MDKAERFDVVCFGFDGVVKWVEPDKTAENANAVVGMAIMRQGLEDRFFCVEPAGKYKKGDKR